MNRPLVFSEISAHPAPDAPPPAPKLLMRVRDHLRTRHSSLRTEATHMDWVRRCILFHDKRHPQDMGAAEVEAFLTHLAVDQHVAASTQNQGKSAILYLYKQVLCIELPWLDDVVQAKTPRRLPVVLTAPEVRSQLLYGTGRRLLESLRLRVKDVKFSRREIVIREGKEIKTVLRYRPKISCCHCKSKSRKRGCCMRKIWRPVLAAWICRMRWR